MLENDSIELINGNTIRMVKEEVLGNNERFSVNHPEAIDSLSVGDSILLENAKMRLEVISKEEDGVTCKGSSRWYFRKQKKYECTWG